MDEDQGRSGGRGRADDDDGRGVAVFDVFIVSLKYWGTKYYDPLSSRVSILSCGSEIGGRRVRRVSRQD